MWRDTNAIPRKWITAGGHIQYGGFHLAGKNMEAVVEQTTSGLQEIDPEYIIPVHCTGREAIASIEKTMPEKLIINMAGTKITLSA